MKMEILVAVWVLALGAAFWCFLRGGRAGGGCGGCGSGACGPRRDTGPDEDLRVEIFETKDTGPCDHCGLYSRQVAGAIWQDDIKIALFFVHWTLGRSSHPANYDLVLGDFSDQADPAGRIGLSLSYRNDDHGPGFSLIDAKGRPFDRPALLGNALSRAEVLGTPLVQEAFDLVDCIFLSATQFQEIETIAGDSTDGPINPPPGRDQ